METVFQRLDGVELQGQISVLPSGEGAILKFPPVELERHRPGVDFDLTLHDVPPASGLLDLAMPLDELPAMIIDTETTGLDVNQDRIVSFGGVCAHGARIHGITDEMVAGARAFPEVYADFQQMAQGRVIIGHNIPFDLTIIRQECARHGRPWEDLVFIDTRRLASLLNPALGDAMVAAEVYFRMLPRLQMQGFTTLRDLLEFHCHQAVDVIAIQKQAGWITNQPARLRAQAGEP